MYKEGIFYDNGKTTIMCSKSLTVRYLSDSESTGIGGEQNNSTKEKGILETAELLWTISSIQIPKFRVTLHTYYLFDFTLPNCQNARKL